MTIQELKNNFTEKETKPSKERVVKATFSIGKNGGIHHKYIGFEIDGKYHCFVSLISEKEAMELSQIHNLIIGL